LENKEYNLSEEIDLINQLNSIDLVKYLVDKLTEHATGKNINPKIYSILRLKLISNPILKDETPNWVKLNSSLDEFWKFIKTKFSNYRERRMFISDEFAPLLVYLEFDSQSPLSNKFLFEEEHIFKIWHAALARKTLDPEGAITMARTLVETTIKFILDESQIKYNDTDDLIALNKIVAKSLNLAPEQHQEQIFKQILQGISSIVAGLGTLRNKLGDAHGKSKKNIKPNERHSEFAVHLAGSVSLFLIQSFKEKLLKEGNHYFSTKIPLENYKN